MSGREVSEPDERDRDRLGRPRSARPRDDLGRPLPPGSTPAADETELAALAELEAADPVTLLGAAQALLDAGKPFQAHELLEARWKRAPEGERQLWRALAQLAVGMTHRMRGNEPGAAALFRRAAEGLEAVTGPAPYDIDASGLATQARELTSAASGPDAESPAGNRLVLRLRQRGSAR